MTHPNADLVQNTYDAFSRGDMDALGEIFAKDISFSIPGSTPLTGEYKGQEQVFGFFQQVMELSGGTFKMQAHSIIADDEHAVGLLAMTAERNGKSAGYNSVHVFHVDDGKLTEVWEFPDQPAFDDFWS